MTDLLDSTSPTTLVSTTLREIAEITDDAVVTVAVPTEKATSEPQQNALQLKTATQRIAQQLGERGLDPQQVADATAPLEQLQSDEELWSYQLGAFYVTVWGAGWRAFRLPYRVRELAVVDRRPHLQPLLPAVADEGAFFVLALSQGHVRLLRATRHSIAEVSLPDDMPRNVDDAIVDDDAETPGLQHRSGSRGGDVAIFHGHGGPGEYDRVLVDKFLRQVARAVDDVLVNEPHPVVLAGVDEVCAQYRQHTGLRTVVDDNVSGNPDEARDAQLRDHAWPLVRPLLRRDVEDAVSRFRANHGTGLALGDLPEILPAAEMGRVASLLVRDGAQRWGRFDPTVGLAADRAAPVGPGDEDLVEHAIALTLTRGGDAHVLAADEMPLDGDVAAVCRY